MKDEMSFAEIVAREGVAPAAAKTAQSGGGKLSPRRREIVLPPDGEGGERFADMKCHAMDGVDRRRLRDMARRRPEAELDLHGMTAAAAHSALESFLRAQFDRGRREVEIIHGRGEHSADGRAVLRGKTRMWLAGCDAALGFIETPHNSGSTRVLLRRRAD